MDEPLSDEDPPVDCRPTVKANPPNRARPVCVCIVRGAPVRRGSDDEAPRDREAEEVDARWAVRARPARIAPPITSHNGTRKTPPIDAPRPGASSAES